MSRPWFSAKTVWSSDTKYMDADPVKFVINAAPMLMRLQNARKPPSSVATAAAMNILRSTRRNARNGKRNGQSECSWPNTTAHEMRPSNALESESAKVHGVSPGIHRRQGIPARYTSRNQRGLHLKPSPHRCPHSLQGYHTQPAEPHRGHQQPVHAQGRTVRHPDHKRQDHKLLSEVTSRLQQKNYKWEFPSWPISSPKSWGPCCQDSGSKGAAHLRLCALYSPRYWCPTYHRTWYQTTKAYGQTLRVGHLAAGSADIRGASTDAPVVRIDG